MFLWLKRLFCLDHHTCKMVYVGTRTPFQAWSHGVALDLTCWQPDIENRDYVVDIFECPMCKRVYGLIYRKSGYKRPVATVNNCETHNVIPVKGSGITTKE